MEQEVMLTSSGDVTVVEGQNSANDATELENALEEGLANEPEVVCADVAGTTESGCTPEVQTPNWPVAIALGAVGTVAILAVILAVASRKKGTKR